jgi:hypothetical protein
MAPTGIKSRSPDLTLFFGEEKNPSPFDVTPPFSETFEGHFFFFDGKVSFFSTEKLASPEEVGEL